MRLAPALLAPLAMTLALAGCANDASTATSATSTPAAASSAPPTSSSRAVVIVSGGGATTPFTTPTQACSDAEGFLSAGNTATALRDYLLAQGKQVYTAPTDTDWGTVTPPDPDSFGPFKDCPAVLPEAMTIMSAADIGWGGERLARFLMYLHDEYGVTDVDLVGHSNGGLWSRSAIWVLKQTGAPITVHSLTTLGTPHEGSVPGRYQAGEIGRAECQGNAFCEKFNEDWIPYANLGDKGINHEDTVSFLDGPTGWNLSQGDALQGIPVTLLGGTYWSDPAGDPTVWPYDGIVSRYSAWATDVPDSVMPHRACWSGPLTHSIFVSNVAKQDWSTALTWNTDALARVNEAIDGADTALDEPNRQGCE